MFSMLRIFTADWCNEETDFVEILCTRCWNFRIGGTTDCGRGTGRSNRKLCEQLLHRKQVLCALFCLQQPDEFRICDEHVHAWRAIRRIDLSKCVTHYFMRGHFAALIFLVNAIELLDTLDSQIKPSLHSLRSWRGIIGCELASWR